MEISGKTKVIGIFGDPVEHSLSPLMHNAVIKELGLDMVYVPWRVRPAMLEVAIMAIRALGIPGVNLTIPHKEKVLKYLDEIDDEARITGAVNTVVNDNGALVGYNTDGAGLAMSLYEEHAFSPEGKNITIIGAGGAARGIAASMAMKGAGRICIANRTPDRAENLAHEFSNEIAAAAFVAVGLEGGALKEILSNTDLLVNASSAGMNGVNNLHLPLEALPKEAIVSDIVYKPIQTTLLLDAVKLGLRVEDGLGMLACQGAMSFSLWTGHSPPAAIMKKSLKKEVVHSSV